MNRLLLLAVLLGLFCAGCTMAPTTAATAGVPAAAATLTAQAAQVRYGSQDDPRELPTPQSVALGIGDQVSVVGGLALLQFRDFVTVHIYPGTRLVNEIDPAAPAAYRYWLQGGTTRTTLDDRVAGRVSVRTDWATITATGTDFIVNYDNQAHNTWVGVLAGTVGVDAGGVHVEVHPQQQTWVAPNSPAGPVVAADRALLPIALPPLDQLTNGAIKDSTVFTTASAASTTGVVAATATPAVALGTATPTGPPATPLPATASIRPGGGPVTATIAQVGQQARIAFTGQRDNIVSLQLSLIQFTPGSTPGNFGGMLTLSLIPPSGKAPLLTAPLFNGTDPFFGPITLPESGTYTIQIVPYDANLGSLMLVMYAVPSTRTEQISVGGPSVFVATSTPGEQLQLSFAGRARQIASFQLSRIHFTPGTAPGNFGGMLTMSLVAPGTRDPLLKVPVFNDTDPFFGPVTLPGNGTYTLQIAPYDRNVGGLALQVYDVPATTVIPITFGKPVTLVTQVPGEKMQMSFVGRAGQVVSMQLSKVQFSPGTAPGNFGGMLVVKLTAPNGKDTSPDVQVFNQTEPLLGPVTLPDTGSYSVDITPYDRNVGTLTAELKLVTQ